MKKAFTLIELLVVVLIIGILAAIALPQYQLIVEKARFMEGVVWVKNINDAQQRYYMANAAYTTDLSRLDIQVPSGVLKYFNLFVHLSPTMHVESRRNIDLGGPVWITGFVTEAEHICCEVASSQSRNSLGVRVCRSLSGSSAPLNLEPGYDCWPVGK